MKKYVFSDFNKFYNGLISASTLQFIFFYPLEKEHANGNQIKATKNFNFRFPSIVDHFDILNTYKLFHRFSRLHGFELQYRYSDGKTVGFKWKLENHHIKWGLEKSDRCY